VKGFSETGNTGNTGKFELRPPKSDIDSAQPDVEIYRACMPAFYRAFCDASGGVGADSYSLAIGHKQGEHFVIDLVRGTGGKFDPDVVTQEYAALLKEYRIFQVTGDSYAAQWVMGAWRKAGIGYFKSELPKSQIYLECLPLFARGLVRLPNHQRLLRELRLLERHTAATATMITLTLFVACCARCRTISVMICSMAALIETRGPHAFVSAEGRPDSYVGRPHFGRAAPPTYPSVSFRQGQRLADPRMLDCRGAENPGYRRPRGADGVHPTTDRLW
jgi:hypothetical protein